MSGRRLRGIADERGIALVMALGILLVLSITAAAAVTYSGKHVRNVQFDASAQKAAAIAEAGLNEAYAILANASDPRNPSSLPPGGTTYEGGSVAWSAYINGDTWSVASTSTVKNPSGAADIHRTVTGQLRIGVDGAGYAPAWQYVYAENPGCTEVSNNAQISAPFYLQGDLCLKNSATLTASQITVKGKIKLENSSSIGQAGTPIDALHVGPSGCSTGGSYSFANCDAAHRVYAGTVDSTFANIAKPTVDLPYWYVYAKPGPKANCTSGSFPGGFDNNSVMDTSLPDVTLLPSTPYSCTVTSGASTLGRISWTPGTPGTLSISGVIFVDGDIRADGQGIYTGRGTIYTSGEVNFQNDDYLCGAANCDVDAWDGDTNMVIFVAGASQDGHGFTIQNYAKFQGGIYAVSDVVQQNNTLIEGPVIADELRFQNYTTSSKWPPIDFVADGAPAPIGSTKLIPVSGSWGG